MGQPRGCRHRDGHLRQHGWVRGRLKLVGEVWLGVAQSVVKRQRIEARTVWVGLGRCLC